jgi:rubrerythrin
MYKPAAQLVLSPSERYEIKALNVEDFLPSAWTGVFGDGDAVDVETAYERVAVVRTAVTLRANALASLPWEITTRRGSLVAFDAERLAALIRGIEIDLCLYGAAYLLRDPAALLGLRRLHPKTIIPVTDPKRGLVGFIRRANNAEIRLEPETELLHIWEPSVRSEVEPGVGLVTTALTQARALLAAERYQTAYFERGAVRPTVWMFAQRPTDAERSRFEQWLRQLVSGIRNAFRHLALSSEIKTVTLGDTLSDAIQPELLQRAAEVMVTAFQVPMSLVFSNASNYATARRDYQTFILLTILARAREVAAMLQPHFAAYNQTLRCNEARIDAVQNEELEKAEAIQRLTGQPVLTLNEARARLDLPQFVEDAADQELLRLRNRLAIAREAVAAGLDTRTALRLAGVNGAEPTDDAAKSLKKDETESGLMPHEVQLYRDLKRAFQQLRQVMLDGADEITAKEFNEILYPAMRRNIETIARLFADEMRVEVGVAVNVDALLADWAEEATRRQVEELLYPYTRDYIARAVAAWRRMPGADRAELIQMIEPVVGAKRAETVAITAATEAATAGVRAYREGLRAEHNLEYVMIWETANDERVCPICGALHGKREDEWGGRSGPPAHPRCRCGVRLERVNAG